MSRIGKVPVPVPSGVDVTISGALVTIKGPKGSLEHVVPAPIEVAVNEAGAIVVARPNDERASRSLHGLTRTLLANIITGVTEGYEKKLEIVGTGYRVAAKGSDWSSRSASATRWSSHRLRASRSLSKARPSSRSAASASSRWARSPRTSERSASRSLTRARECGTPARLSAARPERLVSNHGSQDHGQGQSRCS